MVFSKLQRQPKLDASGGASDIGLIVKTMETNRVTPEWVATDSGVTQLISLREVWLASCSVDADAWCKQALKGDSHFSFQESVLQELIVQQVLQTQ